jgi:pimeloyl-ACP methyl ester carboxylesterase
MGSGIALRFALDYPSRTRALVLMGAMSKWGGSGDVDDLVATVAAFGDKVDPAFVLDFQLSTVATSVPDIIEVAVDESLRVPARVWREAFAGIARFDVSKELSKITVPTLVLWGGKETIAIFAEQEVLVRGLTHARLRVYEDAGHAIHWDAPERVARDIANFVAQLGTRG